MTDRGSPLASTYIDRLPSRFISSTIERRPRIAPFTVVLQKTDLILTGRLPSALTRSYRSDDMQLGSFGIGGRHAYDTFLVFPTPSATEQLVLVLTDLTRNAIP